MHVDPVRRLLNVGGALQGQVNESGVIASRERPDHSFAPAPLRLANTSLATGNAEKAFGQPV